MHFLVEGGGGVGYTLYYNFTAYRLVSFLGSINSLRPESIKEVFEIQFTCSEMDLSV